MSEKLLFCEMNYLHSAGGNYIAILFYLTWFRFVSFLKIVYATGDSHVFSRWAVKKNFCL